MNEQISYIGDKLPKGFFHLHSKFEKISNYINQYGEILSLACDIKYLHTNTIIFCNNDYKKINDFEMENDFLFIDNKKYQLNKAKKYNSFIDFKLSDIEDKLKNFEILFLKSFNKKSLAFLFDEKLNSNFTTSFEKAFVKHIKSGYSEILSGNILEGISKFRGAGIGLTPSGDDFIAGFLYGLNILELTENQNFSFIKNEILEISKSRNLISNNLLSFSFEGRFFARLKNLIKSINFEENDDINKNLKALFEVGESSGSDILSGILAVFKNKNTLF